jgi:nitric oxide reductase subunit B
MTNPKVRAVLLFVLILAFGVLGFGGYLINKEKPPIPNEVVTESGEILFTNENIQAGQEYYFSRGGQHIGSVWGHGSYLAPDWSADYLHRLGLFSAARYHGLDVNQASSFTQDDFEKLPPGKQGELQATIAASIKTNRYDQITQTLVFTPYQAEAYQKLTEYYTELFRGGNEDMGLQSGIVRTDQQGRDMTAFFAWLAWAAGTNRPDQPHTYTNNWPYDPLVGNTPLPDALIWSIVSVILLIFLTAVVLFVYLRFMREEDYQAELRTKMEEPQPTPSQKMTLPYFLIAIILFVAQIGLGSVVAHYTVEGTYFYGIPLGDVMPYALARTWHLQLAIFWIATCFLAAGLFIGPHIGKEPKRQGLLSGMLLGAVAIVIFGTLGGSWLSVTGRMESNNFLFGHQGYEYIELGRVWQLLLIAGMVIWLFLVIRAIKPALSREEDYGGITHMLLYSAAAIPLFYMAGLMYGSGSHLSDAEYWRWWVVHLWVEGFFEVFATVFMAFLLSYIGAVSKEFSLKTIYLSTFLYLGSGVIGTFHHLYFTGTPTSIIALGAVFSALEIIPLTLLAFEVVHNLQILKKGGKDYPYKWPLNFFIAVAFWNIVGAGVFGFLLNPPIVLYYIQGINTTPIHSHAALFGVYGFFAIALMLFSVRHVVSKASWSDNLLKWSFWGLNGGLMAMLVFSLIPSGFYQFYYAVKDGLWYARSPVIASSKTIRLFSWVRLLPDLVFAAGAVILFLFLFRAIYITLTRR